jgi:lipoprotein-releasing system permease protein
MIELFIAKRYLRSKRKLNFITIISILSTLGITIGVAALVVVLSVFNGFGSLVTSMLVSFDPHLRISVIDEKGYSQTGDVEKLLERTAGIKSHSAYVEGKVILLNKRSYEIVNLKGFDIQANDTSWGVDSKIISGSRILKDDSIGNIILGLPIALRLSARVGDTVNATSAYNIEKTITGLSIPQTNRFIVKGIFESGNRDYDVSYTFTTLSAGQQLFGLNNQITGYELRLDNFKQAEEMKQEFYKKLDPNNFSIKTWYDLHKELYNVMLIERWTAYILLCLIIAVAVFNIFASLAMTVIEKKKDIGILKSMGLAGKSIQKIFLFEGILVGATGIITGLIIGTLVCYLQMKFNFYPLDPTKYIINAMPVEIRISDLFAIGIMAMLLTFLAALYPAKRAANTNITESIKYE